MRILLNLPGVVDVRGVLGLPGTLISLSANSSCHDCCFIKPVIWEDIFLAQVFKGTGRGFVDDGAFPFIFTKFLLYTIEIWSSKRIWYSKEKNIRTYYKKKITGSNWSEEITRSATSEQRDSTTTALLHRMSVRNVFHVAFELIGIFSTHDVE